MVNDLYERACLTDKQREALDLYDEGMGYAKIGFLLGIDKSTVRQRLAAAQLKLRKARKQKNPPST